MMNRQLAATCAGLLIMGLCVGCSKPTVTQSETKKPITPAVKAHEHEHEHEHQTAHGGSLNAIVTCENGHAEVKLENNKLCLWFVGGGTDTTKSVRVFDSTVVLNIKVGSTTKPLILAAKPLELAGEKVGDCSYFEASMPELANVKEFTADGQVTFKGKKMPIRIDYPKGYDPD